MSFDEFQHLGAWLIRLVVYGTLAIIAFGFLVVILRSFRANLRSRGIIGILIGVIKLAIYIGVILILVYFARQGEWIDKFEAMLP